MVERATDVMLVEILRALAAHDRVELRGFGTFTVRQYDARMARNPSTGNKVHVSEKHVPYFRAGKGLRERLNKSQG
jgi:integration host factor subunit beta